ISQLSGVVLLALTKKYRSSRVRNRLGLISKLPLLSRRADLALRSLTYRCDQPSASDRYQRLLPSCIQPMSLKVQLIQAGLVSRSWVTRLFLAKSTVASQRSLQSLAMNCTARPVPSSLKARLFTETSRTVGAFTESSAALLVMPCCTSQSTALL